MAYKLKPIAILALAAALAVSGACGAERAMPPEQCKDQLLHSQNSWSVVSDATSPGREFTPIVRLIVRHNVMNVQTWGSEPLPADLAVDRESLLLRPKYLAWLGVGGPVDGAAKKVAPFARESVKHTLVVRGVCSSPEEIEVRIEGATDEPLGVLLLKDD